MDGVCTSLEDCCTERELEEEDLCLSSSALTAWTQEGHIQFACWGGGEEERERTNEVGREGKIKERKRRERG